MTRPHTGTKEEHTQYYTHIQTCTYTYKKHPPAHTYQQTHTQIYTHTHTERYTHTHTHTQGEHTHILQHILTHIHTNTYAHTDVHTHKWRAGRTLELDFDVAVFSVEVCEQGGVRIVSRGEQASGVRGVSAWYQGGSLRVLSTSF